MSGLTSSTANEGSSGIQYQQHLGKLDSGISEDERLDAPPVPWLHGAAGIASGAISMTMFYPLDLLRTRMHTHDGTRKFSTIKEICQKEGAKGMYRGVGVAVGSHALGWGLYLSLFRACQNKSVAWNGSLSAGGDFLSACCAATLTATAVTPLNLLKVRTQLAKSGQREAPPRGVVKGLRHIAKTEGFRALFNGLGPQVLLSSHTTIQVALYECIKREVWGSHSSDIPMSGIVASSAISKGVASVICNPLEVIRTRTQDQKARGSLDYRSMGAAFQTLWRAEGIHGMYRGVAVNMCRVIPTTVCAFVLYESFIKVFHPKPKRVEPLA
eukprot:GILI01016377.1.p1 GENE.GILI01016377.1~~GILI01016377.1.p1  ORF type:complete len:327 (+),score=27.94 GILI01016377.1:219-1199(+)